MAKGDCLVDPFHAPRWVAMAGVSAWIWLKFAFIPPRVRNEAFHSPQMPTLVLLLAVFLLFSLLSLGRVHSLAEGLWTLTQHVTYVILLLGLAHLAVLEATESKKLSLFYAIGLVMMILGISHAMLAMAAAQGWMTSPFESGWGPAGWSGNRNLVAGFQVLVLPWAFYVALVGVPPMIHDATIWLGHPFSLMIRSGALLLSGLAAGLGGYALGLCQSRASLLASLIGLCFAGGLGILRRIRFHGSIQRVKPLTLWLAVGLLVLFAMGFLSQANRIQPATQVSVFEKLALSTQASHPSHTSLVERLALWKKTLGLIAGHPFLGVGVGQWKIAWPSQGLAGLPQQDMSVMHTRPHNDWLWVSSEVGLIGGLAYLLLPLMAIIFAVRAFLRASTWPQALGPLCMGSGVVAYVTLASFDFPRERAEHTLAFSVLMAFAFASRPPRPPGEVDIEPQGGLTKFHRAAILPSLAGGIFLLSLGCATFGWLRWQTEKTIFNLVATHLQKEGPSTLMAYASIPKWSGDMSTTGTPLAWYAGLAAIPSQERPSNPSDRHASWRVAEELFHQATHLHPYFIHAWNDRATAQLNLGDTLGAVASLQSLQRVAPGYAKSIYPLAWLLHKQGKTQAALGVLDSIPEAQRDENWLRLRKALLENEKDGP